MSQYLQAKQNEFISALDFFKKEISALRTGRANPAGLDSVQVEAYGVMNPVNAVGNIAVADARSIVIVPWDKSVAKAIEKAIVDAGLGSVAFREGQHFVGHVEAVGGAAGGDPAGR